MHCLVAQRRLLARALASTSRIHCQIAKASLLRTQLPPLKLQPQPQQLQPHQSTRSMSSKAPASLHTATHWRVDSPYSGEIEVEIPILTQQQADAKINSAQEFFHSKEWRQHSLDDRIALVREWINEFRANKAQIALDISRQTGKPLAQAQGEVEGGLARAAALCEMSREALATHSIAETTPGLVKKITLEPIGVVLVLVPYNYPVLCAVNSVIHAVLAGCTVLLKHSERSPTVADAFANAFAKLQQGKYKHLVQAFHASNDTVAHVIRNSPHIAYVSFTGSVRGGQSISASIAAAAQHATNPRFIDSSLELGGKDAAYVAEDADVAYAASNIVDGACYNSGQSCCSVERVYVHAKVYDAFIAESLKAFAAYKMGDPVKDANVNFGPLAQPHQAQFIEKQVNEAVGQGAKLLHGGKASHDSKGKGRFFEPTLMVNVNHQMSIMRDETFGPVMPVMRVESEEEAVKLINDSQFGLTASVWTASAARAESLCKQIDCGTVFQNRCDFLDPYLPWSGRRQSGKGIGLSTLGFAPFVRTKAYNLRVSTA